MEHRLWPAVLGPAVAIGLALLAAPSARTAFPGANGQIVYARSSLASGGARSDLWTMAPDGSGRARLTPGADAADFSADGRAVVIAEGRFLHTALTVVDPLGRRQITAAGPLSHARMSPNGRTVAFLHLESGRASIIPRVRRPRYTLFVVGVNGQGLQPLRRIRGGAFGLAWSPDGTRLAYSVTAPGARHSTIYTLALSGGPSVALVRVRGAVLGLDFSPDGRALVYAIGLRSRGGVSVVALPGGAIRHLAGTTSADFDPLWSPDGSTILFARDYLTPPPRRRLRAVQVLAVPAAGGGVRVLAGGPSIQIPVAWRPVPGPAG